MIEYEGIEYEVVILVMVCVVLFITYILCMDDIDEEEGEDMEIKDREEDITE